MIIGPWKTKNSRQLMKRGPIITVVLVTVVVIAIAAAELGWLGGSGPSAQRTVRDLITGRPVALAEVVTVDSYRPPLASMFSSADPQRCRAIRFARTDDAGRLPSGIRGGVAFVRAPEVKGLAPDLMPVQEGSRYVLVAQRLQGGEGGEGGKGAEAFGPGHATQAAADAAREAFLASPEGREYTAFTVRPDGQSEFRNYRQLQVKWIEVARGAQAYADLPKADEALRASAWTLPGRADLTELRRALEFCGDARAEGLELAGPLLDALERSPPPDAPPDAHHARAAQQALQHWRARLGR